MFFAEKLIFAPRFDYFFQKYFRFVAVPLFPLSKLALPAALDASSAILLCLVMIFARLPAAQRC